MRNRLPDWFKATPTSDRLTRRQLRLLLAVVAMQRGGGAATVRGVARLCGVRYWDAFAVLTVLRRRGLVTWHPVVSDGVVPLVAVALARRDGPGAGG